MLTRVWNKLRRVFCTDENYVIMRKEVTIFENANSPVESLHTHSFKCCKPKRVIGIGSRFAIAHWTRDDIAENRFSDFHALWELYRKKLPEAFIENKFLKVWLKVCQTKLINPNQHTTRDGALDRFFVNTIDPFHEAYADNFLKNSFRSTIRRPIMINASSLETERKFISCAWNIQNFYFSLVGIA